MLKAIYRDPLGVMRFVEWKVGMPTPFKEDPQIVWNVGEVQASGEELSFIQTNIIGLPRVNTSNDHTRYLGDYAKLIAANLPLM